MVLFLSEKENAFTTYDRHVLSILCNHVAISIAEAQAHAQVERLAITDGLTGVYNHRRFQERLQEEFVRNARHPEPFSILMIDIDFFKRSTTPSGIRRGRRLEGHRQAPGQNGPEARRGRPLRGRSLWSCC